MRKVALVVLGLLVGSAASWATEADEAAIKSRLDQFAAAWDKHDAKAMAALWAPDGDLINPFGRVATGRAAVEALIAEEHATGLGQSTFAFTAMRSTVLPRPDVAVSTSDIRITGGKDPQGQVGPPMDMILTLVLVKNDGQWWVLSARPMMPLHH